MADLGKILLMPKGNYDNSTTYEFLDMVMYDRSTYVCKVASSLGVLPTNTTNWQIMSEHGADAFGYGYIRYSEHADGTDFVPTPTATTDYIGFYMGNSVTPPVDKTTYTWSKFVGHDGAAGVGISSIVKTSTSGLVDTYTITYTDGTTSTFNVVNGTGNAIYYDTSMINTSNVAQTYPTSGIASAVINDMNVNPASWNVYKCTVSGSPSVAEWLYIGNIKGASGTGSGDMQSADFVGSSATRSVHAADTLNTTLGNVDQLNSSDFQVVSSVLEIKDSVKDIDAFGVTTTLVDSNTVAVSTGSASNRKITWANIKALLKTYFDGIYSTFSGSYNDLTDTPNFATIATTGAYADATGKPSINGHTLSGNQTAADLGLASSSDIPTVDQTYDATSTNAQSGTAVADALTNYYDKSEIDAQEKNLVSYGGAVTFANLPALSAANVNKFWLVTDSFTTTSDFVVGAGVVMPADSHIAIINTGTDANPVYKYDDFGGFVDTSALQTKAITSMTIKGASVSTVTNALTALNDGLDDWTSTATVTSSGTVTFTGLNDDYGYELYCQNKLIGISAMTKTGSGTSVQIVYTVTGAATGDVCKLRILK